VAYQEVSSAAQQRTFVTAAAPGDGVLWRKGGGAVLVRRLARSRPMCASLSTLVLSGSLLEWLVLISCAAVCLCLCRTMYGVPVTVSDSQLFIPQPEWDALANEARQAPSFAMQLQSELPGWTGGAARCRWRGGRQ
jgi:hypothetical protein